MRIERARRKQRVPRPVVAAGAEFVKDIGGEAAAGGHQRAKGEVGPDHERAGGEGDHVEPVRAVWRTNG